MLVAPPRTAAVTRSTRVARRSSASSVMATRRRILGSSIRYRPVLAVPDGRRTFLVVVVRAEDFCVVEGLVVDFFAVGFAEVLLPALAAVDLLAVLAAGVGVAIASIRVFGFLGIVARTSRTASVCCSSVMRNSWCPSRLATKYR